MFLSGSASPSDPVPSLAQRAPDEARERPAFGRGGPSLPLGPPTEGGTRAEGGSDPACIENSGQKLNTPDITDFSALRMVGSGKECEIPGWTVAAVCPRCGHHVQLVKTGCGRVECPRCSKRWARRAAERSAARVYGAFMAAVSRWKPRHITFELDTFSWKEAKKKAEEIGCTGGVLVLHPWRIKPDLKERFEREAEATGRNRYDLAKTSELGMAAFDFAPHCHAIVYGKFRAVEKGSTAYAYRNIRRLNSQGQTEGTLNYLFGHTFIPLKENAKCYRYFGICSPQRLKPEWTGTCSDSLKCPKCQTEMVTEEGGEVILYKRFIALGWHAIKPRLRASKGAAPPEAPQQAVETPDPFKKWAPA